MTHSSIKHQVRDFYNQVGWQLVGDDTYQNARYEDLRPVSREYIHRCHLRVKRHLAPRGRFLLDAGSGPVQYIEYLTYSSGYHRRVCLDISIVALQEARKRIGEHGLFVVADVANLPFKPGAFDGLVSLHTLHHLPAPDQEKAYAEFYRVLAEDRAGVVVNGWTDSALMRRTLPLVQLFERLGDRLSHSRTVPPSEPAPSKPKAESGPTGTFIHKLDAAWLRRVLAGHAFEIRVWRSVSVRFMRAVIHTPLAGNFWLKLLFFMEERFPRWFGEKGQYPLVVIRK
jgi:SAM-dependent methyltransferase